jgi:hypothetical protein
MLRIWIGIVASVAMLGACAPLSPSVQSTAAPRIEGTPGKAVIYIVRTRPDLSYLTAPLALDDQMIGATNAGTYFRLEVAPGHHRIAGYAQDSGAINLDVQANRVYFVQHTVAGSWRATSPNSFFHVIDESRARAAMAGAVRAG